MENKFDKWMTGSIALLVFGVSLLTAVHIANTETMAVSTPTYRQTYSKFDHIRVEAEGACADIAGTNFSVRTLHDKVAVFQASGCKNQLTKIVVGDGSTFSYGSYIFFASKAKSDPNFIVVMWLSN